MWSFGDFCSSLAGHPTSAIWGMPVPSSVAGGVGCVLCASQRSEGCRVRRDWFGYCVGRGHRVCRRVEHDGWGWGQGVVDRRWMFRVGSAVRFGEEGTHGCIRVCGRVRLFGGHAGGVRARVEVVETLFAVLRTFVTSNKQYVRPAATLQRIYSQSHSKHSIPTRSSGATAPC